LKFFVELLEAEMGGVKRFDVCHTSCDVPKEVSQAFVVFFSEVEEGVVCIETRSRFALLVELLQSVPYLFRIASTVTDVVLLGLVDAKKNSSCRRIPRLLPFHVVHPFLASRGIDISKFGLRVSPNDWKPFPTSF
jgi:hypothetical protein